MRSVGLGTLVVAVIFAAAFGVYFWLIGDPEPKTQVAGSTTQQTSDAETTATSTPDVAPAAEQQVGTAQDAQGKADAGTPQAGSSASGQPEAQQAKTPEAQEETTQQQASQQQSQGEKAATATESAEAQASTGGNTEAGSAALVTAAPAQEAPARPKAPQVVARADPTTQLSTPEQPAQKEPSGQVPSFDVVRVEKTGEAILAGRAPAGSEVTIYDGDVPLGIVVADSRGQWVLILDIPLQPGNHSLGITARQGDDTVVESAELVIVAVPEPRLPEPQTQDVAQAPAQSQSAQAAAASASDPANVSATAPEPQQAESQRSAEGLAGETQVAVVSDPAGDSEGEPRTEPADSQTDRNSDAAPDADDSAESPVAPSQVAAADVGLEDPIAVVVPRHGSGPTRILQQPELLEDGIGNGSLFLDSVDYDDEGRAVIGGRATPGASLIIYLDNLPIGEALSDDGGRWVMTPDNLVPVGLHQLRVDQIESGGRVLARVETPFSRADTVESHPDESFVTVQPGNSLWRIARAAYGQGTRYTVIYESNKSQIRDPDLIYPGQIFRLPSDG